jgi:hypothetical protein
MRRPSRPTVRYQKTIMIETIRRRTMTATF